MKVLEDKKTGLVWYTPEIIYEDKKVKMNKDDARSIIQFKKELNGWKSDNISEFITGRSDALGDLLGNYINLGGYKEYFVFDDGKMVASVVLRDPQSMSRSYIDLHVYKCYCERKGIDGVEGYLALDKTKNAMKVAEQDVESHIRYVVVVPEKQGKGIGTRVLLSINNNSQYFETGNQNRILTAEIHKFNFASKHLFMKNNYYSTYKDYRDKFMGFDMFYNIM